MNQIWITDANMMVYFFETVGKIQKELDVKLNRRQRELVFFEIMKSKNIKPSGNTELNREELISELVSHGKSVLNIDEKGCTIIKNKIKEK